MNRHHNALARLFLAAVLAFAVSPRAAAQGASTGAIRGVVRDPPSALIPGAALNLKDTATGVEKTRGRRRG